MKLFIPSMPVSAAWTNDWMAAEEIPCASGVLRGSADCAGARCATATRRTSEAERERRVIDVGRCGVWVTSGAARSTAEQLEPLRWQGFHWSDSLTDSQ